MFGYCDLEYSVFKHEWWNWSSYWPVLINIFVFDYNLYHSDFLNSIRLVIKSYLHHNQPSKSSWLENTFVSSFCTCFVFCCNKITKWQFPAQHSLFLSLSCVPLFIICKQIKMLHWNMMMTRRFRLLHARTAKFCTRKQKHLQQLKLWIGVFILKKKWIEKESCWPNFRRWCYCWLSPFADVLLLIHIKKKRLNEKNVLFVTLIFIVHLTSLMGIPVFFSINFHFYSKRGCFLSIYFLHLNIFIDIHLVFANHI